MDFLRPGLKTGVGNGIFWSEIGSGFGDAGGTPQPKISTSTPPPPGVGYSLSNRTRLNVQVYALCVIKMAARSILLPEPTLTLSCGTGNKGLS